MGESISGWIEGAKQGDEEAIRALWNRYHPHLLRFARGKLPPNRRRVADEEDVVSLAFKSFFFAARAGRFPELKDSDGLWKLLLKMTARKAVDLKRHEGRKKRRVLGESVLIKTRDESSSDAMSRIAGSEPAPDFGALVTDECRRLLDQLGDRELENLALAKLEGLGNEEIAKRLGYSLRTVERQLQLIRKKWEGALGEGSKG
jgi:RNA polymerase sigma factor (sigma-70 family)